MSGSLRSADGLAVRSCAVLLVASAIACNPGRSERDASNDADAAIIERALLAQTGGWGGCRSLDRVVPVTIPHFPSVSFHEGVCVAEHGDTVRSAVGRDAAGVLYLIGSPAAFRFLITSHPPEIERPDDFVDYAVLALALIGEVEWGTIPVRDFIDLPVTARTELARYESRIQPVVVEETEATIDLGFTAFSQSRVTRFLVTVTRAGDIVVSSREDLWARPATTH